MAFTMVTSGVLENPKTPQRAAVLDTRGLLCPYPYIQARQALEALPVGASLEILTDSEPTATSSVPILCEQNGYTFTSTKTDGIWRLVVRKPQAGPASRR